MLRRSLVIFILASALSLSAGFVLAADQERAPGKNPYAGADANIRKPAYDA